MKYLILIVLVLFFSINGKAQDTVVNPYSESLKEYVKTELEGIENLKIDTLYVMQKQFVTDNLIKKIVYNDQMLDVKIVDLKEILKGKITFIIEILPIRLIDSNLSIGVLNFGVEIKGRKRINLIKSNSLMRYDLKFDCNTSKFYVKKNDDY